jgi:hypothetical protein
MRNYKKKKKPKMSRPQIKNSCGKGKKGCNYEGEATLVSTHKLFA